MGKKRVIKKTAEELIKEKDKIEQKMKKEVSVKSFDRFKKARIYIYSTYNNTIITLTDSEGNALLWKSAGNIGFKGTKKGTSYAGSQVARAMADICTKMKIREVDVFVKGIGGGRDSALKTLIGHGIEVVSIKDVTPIPHNGCKPPKPRRV